MAHEVKTGPLDGTRVVDLTRIVAGPLCTRMLADLGADVVKIEPPEGDMTRVVGPFVDGVSPYYAQMNAGKRNLCVDLKRDGAAQIVAQLLTTADVVVENFRPGVLAQYGLDAPTMLAANPRLVYCSISGWGQDGPWKDRRGSAPVVHAEVGTVAHAAKHRRRGPEQEVHQHGDVYTATLATSAILAALLERTRTGRGQHLDIALAQAAVYVDEWAGSALQRECSVEEYGGFDTWNYYFYGLGDGSMVTIVGSLIVRFPAWAAALGAGDDVLSDPRFATVAARERNVDDLIAAFDRLTRQFPDRHALETALGARAAVAQVRSLADLAQTEWAADRELLVEIAPGLPVPAAPWMSSTTTIGVRPFVSRRGGDNAAVLAELGLSEADIAALHRAGVLLHDNGSQ